MTGQRRQLYPSSCFSGKVPNAQNPTKLLYTRYLQSLICLDLFHTRARTAACFESWLIQNRSKINDYYQAQSQVMKHHHHSLDLLAHNYTPEHLIVVS